MAKKLSEIRERITKGLNKTFRAVPLSQAKRPNEIQTTPGSAPDNGKLREELGYAAPTVGNNNYAQTLPAPIDTSKKKVKYKVDRRDIAQPGDVYGTQEDVIMSLDDLTPIFEDYLNEAKKPSKVERKYLGMQRGTNATGSRAHPINVKPVAMNKDEKFSTDEPGRVATKIHKAMKTATGKPGHKIDTGPKLGDLNKGWNKTIPSGPQGGKA